MLDLHILYLPTDDPDLLDQAVESVKAQGVVPRLVPGVVGHIGRARLAAYASSSAELVGHVDSDDYLEPGWIDAVLGALKPEHVGAHSSYSMLFPDGRMHRCKLTNNRACMERAIMRREAVLPHLPVMGQYSRGADGLLVVRLCDQLWGSTPHTGYVWRQR
jgi:hypothetical protein